MSSGVGSDTDTAMQFQGDAFGSAEDYATDMFGQASANDDRVEPDNPPALMEVSDEENDDNEDDDNEDNDNGDDDKQNNLEMAAMVVELEKS
jgi:hypothetical protein